MPLLSRPELRWSALIGLWTLVAAVLWVLLVQVFLLLLNPFCHVQPPSLARVAVVSVDRDAESQLTDFVTVKQDRAEQVLRMTKAEAAELRPEDEVWILSAWYADGLRPAQFRLTPLRLLLEYPILLLLPAAWGLWRVRQARLKVEATPAPPAQRTFTDDFHLRAQRFAKGEANQPAAQRPEQRPKHRPEQPTEQPTEQPEVHRDERK